MVGFKNPASVNEITNTRYDLVYTFEKKTQKHIKHTVGLTWSELWRKYTLGRFEKWLMSKCQNFQANLWITQKSKTYGTITAAL